MTTPGYVKAFLCENKLDDMEEHWSWPPSLSWPHRFSFNPKPPLTIVTNRGWGSVKPQMCYSAVIFFKNFIIEIFVFIYIFDIKYVGGTSDI